MATAYYSTIFQEPAPAIWKIVRDFNNYPVWVRGSGESRIEEGKSGDTVGAVRNVRYQGRQVRQRLLALSDTHRSQTYEFCGEPSLPVTAFQATLRITPVIDGDRAFVEWWAEFDCEPARREELARTLCGAGSPDGSNRCEPPWAAEPAGKSAWCRINPAGCAV
jgi:polyketide cyclase/dehydrase/lipid transport protein